MSKTMVYWYYCVCSLHPEEGSEVIEHFLDKNPTWTIVENMEYSGGLKDNPRRIVGRVSVVFCNKVMNNDSTVCPVFTPCAIALQIKETKMTLSQDSVDVAAAQSTDQKTEHVLC